MKKFRVWFKQINETYIDVEAFDKEQAKRIAKGEWKFSVAEPIVTDCKPLP